MLSWEPTDFFFKEENSGTVEEEGPGSSDTPSPRSDVLDPTSFHLVFLAGGPGSSDTPTPRSDVLDPTSFSLVSLTGSEGVRDREAADFEQCAEAMNSFTSARYVSSLWKF